MNKSIFEKYEELNDKLFEPLENGFDEKSQQAGTEDMKEVIITVRESKTGEVEVSTFFKPESYIEGLSLGGHLAFIAMQAITAELRALEVMSGK